MRKNTLLPIQRWALAISCVLLSTIQISRGDTSQIPQAIGLRIQPQLLALSAQQPKTHVRIIIQTKTLAQEVKRQIAQLGGSGIQELSIINAYTAEIPAGAIQKLLSLDDIRWISLDGPVVDSTICSDCAPTVAAFSMPSQSVRADSLWNNSLSLQGNNVTVAVLDSGINSNHPAFKGRILADVKVSPHQILGDFYGHGTFVAGVIAGSGDKTRGIAPGIAPNANVVSVKVTSFAGAAIESDVIAGLQWIYNNRDKYNIRVVNISFNASTAQSYHTSPLNAACEFLWFNGIVVVVSAGNNGSEVLYPPANDPFVITVGATDEQGTTAIQDDLVAPFTAFGTLPDGSSKPDLVAPGRKLIAPLNSEYGVLAKLHPTNVISADYFQMSGTSVAAPVVSGAVALLLQDEPHLTPDQIKYRLKATANKDWPGYTPIKAGAGYLDIYAAVHADSNATSNVGIAPSNLLMPAIASVMNTSVNWSSVNWSSVNWSSVNWSSVNWSSVNWSSVNWSSMSWDDSSWDNQVSSAEALHFDQTLEEGDFINLPVDADWSATTPQSVRVELFLPLVSR